MISLSVFLSISFFLNCVLAWYCRKLAREYVSFVERLNSLEGDLIQFGAHLKSVYELEMFYGDSTLEGLIQHSKQMSDKVTEFYDEYTLEEPEQEDGS
jgi:hypothetical protein